MKRIDAIRIFCLFLMIILCTNSALTAKPSEGERVHRPMWFILSIPGAAYLLLSMLRSEEIGRKERCRTG
jgi:hypothetical protein